MLIIFAVLSTLTSTAVAGTAYSLDVKENSNFTVVVAPPSPQLSLTLSGSAVPNGSASQPCSIGVMCWQPLNDTQYSILDSERVSGSGTIILTPLKDSKRTLAIIIKDVNGTVPDPSLPSGVVKSGEVELDAKEHIALFLIYEHDVRNTRVSGDIEIEDKNILQYDKRLLTIPYNDTGYNGKSAVLLTGHLNKTELQFVGTLTGNDTVTFTVSPQQSRYRVYAGYRVSFPSACAAVLCWNLLLQIFSFMTIEASL
ncbi:hypothetical protein AAHC03_022584 [Spirometra sp. Aus1]